MNNIEIQYCFRFENNSCETIDFNIDGKSLELINPLPKNPPSWADLDFHQCSHCPLNSEKSPHCPLAIRLVDVVKLFDRISSYQQLSVEVITEERHMTQNTTAQRGLSSLMGMIIATSGCPHTTFFKPMVRFHLPFATEEETLFRASATYLLAQYFINKQGGKADFELTGLKKVYENIQIINTSIARRLREASISDASINALVLLDLFAVNMPYVIEESLEEFQYLFESYFLEISSAKDTRM